MILGLSLEVIIVIYTPVHQMSIKKIYLLIPTSLRGGWEGRITALTRLQPGSDNSGLDLLVPFPSREKNNKNRLLRQKVLSKLQINIHFLMKNSNHFNFIIN